MVSKVNIGQDIPNLLSGILGPAPAPTALAGCVGIAMFMVGSYMLVPLNKMADSPSLAVLKIIIDSQGNNQSNCDWLYIKDEKK